MTGRIRCVLLLSLAPVVGCVQPTAVRAYARGSAESAAEFPSVAADLYASCVRTQGYEAASGGVFWLSDAELGKRCSAYRELQPRLRAASATLGEYIAALGAMADDDVVGYDSELEALAGSVASTDIFPQLKVKAVRDLAALVARASTDGYRRRQLARAIADANASVQTVVAGLHDVIAKDYPLSLANEREALDKFYVGQVKAGQGREPLTALLVLAQRDDRLVAIAERERGAAAYARALARIGSGHQRLYDAREHLTSRQLVSQMVAYIRTMEQLMRDVRRVF